MVLLLISSLVCRAILLKDNKKAGRLMVQPQSKHFIAMNENAQKSPVGMVWAIYHGLSSYFIVVCYKVSTEKQ